MPKSNEELKFQTDRAKDAAQEQKTRELDLITNYEFKYDILTVVLSLLILWILFLLFGLMWDLLALTARV